ncbi:cilia- and flagella-associated protein 54-like, partial [Ceratina calcarata]|uniref:Cilia- and flagella-associated protein 54-like n=1 Tax=Ceratina calcarata TaxID=156304 RepID=A0AAJ7N8K4_9HYME
MVSVYGVQLAFYRGRRNDSRGSLVMYDSASCSYAGALELKGASGAGAAAAAASVTAASVKQENWPYRGLTCGSTFQRLKESVDKAKQALADRGGYLSGAFSPPPRANPSAISPTASITGALELKGASGAGAAAAAASVTAASVKQENWPYRGLTCGSTFQRLKESVDKAKQALADRGGYLSGAFSPPPRANPSAISPTASIT